MKYFSLTILFSLATTFLLNTSSSAQQCGSQANGALCQNGMCCSEWGWCGTTADYCNEKCQSQCDGSGGGDESGGGCESGGGGGGGGDGGAIGDIISEALFEEMLKHRNDDGCKSNCFYTYNAFTTAAASFSGFGTTGDDTIRKREIAAFLAQTSHETHGGWASAPDGPYAWGYCYIRELYEGEYCDGKDEWPCVPGQRYFGRGPIQLTHNYNYGPAGEYLKENLLANPDLVATNATISFKAAIWFWMTAQYEKPSSHDVITGRWSPSSADIAAGRVPGFGVITNIINGGLECGHGYNDKVASRIGFFDRYCGMMGVSTGDNLDCYNQRPFG